MPVAHGDGGVGSFWWCLLLAGSCSTLEVWERVMTIMSRILQLEDTIAVQSNDILDEIYKWRIHCNLSNNVYLLRE